MPEFEENNSQKDSTYSYTPSTSTSQNKGGRRRSGGFKSEATAITPKIGEVDPIEILNTEKKHTNKQPSSEVSEKPESQSAKRSKTSSTERAPETTTKAKDPQPQPSKATLSSIKSVEEKIAKRLAESEKNRPAKKESAPKKNQIRPKKKKTSSDEGGLLSAIGRLFNKLIGNSPKDQPSKGRRQTSKRHNSKSQHRNGPRGPRKNSTGNNRTNNRGTPGRRRSNKPKDTY